MTGPRFNCEFDGAKAKFCEIFNAILDKFGLNASQEVTLMLVEFTNFVIMS